MRDEETIIDAHRLCIESDYNTFLCDECPYYEENLKDNCCWDVLRDDAMALLEKYRPVKALRLGAEVTRIHEKIVFQGACSNCGGYLRSGWNACPICGRRLKWSDQ